MSGIPDVDHYSWRQVYVACGVGTRDHEDTNAELVEDFEVPSEREDPEPELMAT